MNKKIHKMTTEITTGAMFIAIFAIILIINRQTGALFEEMFLYILPIPMVAYSARFGWKPSIPVLIAMAFTSFLFGTFTTIFYAVTEAFIGLVMGTCIYKKVDSTKTIFMVGALSAVTNVINTVVLASLFGYNVAEEVAYLQKMYTEMFTKMQETYNMTIPAEMLSTDFLTRMYVISMVLLGLFQGILVYYLCFLILRRLKFKIEKPKSLYYLAAPKWSTYVAALPFFLFSIFFSRMEQGSTLYVGLQTAYLCGYLYLVIFGFIAVMLYMKVKRPGSRLAGTVIACILMMVMPVALLVFGIMYINGGQKKLLDELEKLPVKKANTSYGYGANNTNSAGMKGIQTVQAARNARMNGVKAETANHGEDVSAAEAGEGSVNARNSDGGSAYSDSGKAASKKAQQTVYKKGSISKYARGKYDD